MRRETRDIEASVGRADRDAAPSVPNPTAGDIVTTYPQLCRAFLMHVREVGDLIYVGQEDSARESLRMAAAIESELELTSRCPRI